MPNEKVAEIVFLVSMFVVFLGIAIVFGR